MWHFEQALKLQLDFAHFAQLFLNADISLKTQRVNQ